MRLGIYIPATYPKNAQDGLWATIKDRFDLQARVGAHEDYAAFRLNPPQHGAGGLAKFFTGDPNGLKNNTAQVQASDIIIVAKNTKLADLDRDTEAGLLEEIGDIKRAHPQKKIALYYDVADEAHIDAIKLSPLFNARAGLIDLVYADMRGTKLVKDLDLQPRRAFKALVHHTVIGDLPLPMVSPELHTPSDSATITLDDLIIDRESGIVKHAQAPHYYDFTSLEGRMLGILAAYKGSYLPRGYFMRKLYEKEIAAGKLMPDAKMIDVKVFALGKKFAEFKFGEIHPLWGVGRVVIDGDFRTEPPFTASSNHVYPFNYDETTPALSAAMPNGSNPIILHETEAALFTTLRAANGILVKRNEFKYADERKIPDACLDVYALWLRKSINRLFPTIPGYGTHLIQTIRGRGFRMRTPTEMNMWQDTLTDLAPHAPTPPTPVMA